ncbi:16S rRNA (guanine(527)-N(7))-methyltransferase RsmG [Sphingomonas sp.]|uniref:16S rRNA (guanine(527)-N(7))-methyltransferase RsmG n=1 Tax=Sphingomonas sp. TaxID=28214 RepID=UPI000DAF9298|nr:16S rRNA (guanine(527)-N(7))-methyltransferase RsmG [Sphingomonas sp.]PZU11899.1 MAG: 16S rRNA (guanine(527)-N(7))-methyltransferase RsmG [Sphingomonas sp.]
MIEQDAKARVASNVPHETFARLEQLAELVSSENERQNLIAPSTLPIMWSRHILDSAQLIWLANERVGTWLDIGSGGGFPGIVVGIMRPGPTMLVEPRSKRAAFLREVTETLGVADRVKVFASRVETAPLEGKVSIISARAVAALPALFHMAAAHATESTIWLLPKGRSAADEVAEARREWQGEMQLVPSLSDPDSAIVVAQGVRRKRG